MNRSTVARAPASASPAALATAPVVAPLAPAVRRGAGRRSAGRRGAEPGDADPAREETRTGDRLLEEALRTVAEERSFLACELHDVLGHSLGVIIVQAGAAAQLVEEDPAAVREALEAIRRTGIRSLDEMRAVLVALRGGACAAPFGLAELPLLAAGARSETLAVEYFERGPRPALDPAAQLALYRITQEPLMNVRRHAAARTARVELACSEVAVHLSIADDGLGGTGTSIGNGIRGMQERAARHGGTVRTGQGPDGRGWRVEARLPVGDRG